MQIENVHFFETTEALDFSWLLQGDGCALGSGSLNVPSIAPQSTHLINMKSSPWFTIWSTCVVKEIFLSINVKLRYQTQWAKDGHILASAQICLPPKKGFVPHVRSSTSFWLLLLLNCLILPANYHFQAIALPRSSLVSERVGDHVLISKSNAWQIKVNSISGTIDSWKVRLKWMGFLCFIVLFAYLFDHL